MSSPSERSPEQPHTDLGPDFRIPDDDEETTGSPSPRRGPIRAQLDEAPEATSPKRKKKKRKKGAAPRQSDAEDTHEQSRIAFEWIWPSVILAVGVILTFTGAIGIGGKDGVGHSILVILFGLIVSVPIAVGALIVIGMVAGIEYGRFGPAVLKIAAFTITLNGIWLSGGWVGLPPAVVGGVAFVASLVLFVTQFGLDLWEARVSVLGLNLISFIVKLILMTFLVGASS